MKHLFLTSFSNYGVKIFCLDNEGIVGFALCPINSKVCYVKKEILTQIESAEDQDPNQELNISYIFQ